MRKSGIEQYKEQIKQKNCFTCEHSKKIQFSKETNCRNIYFSGLNAVKVICEYKGLKNALNYCSLYDEKLEIIDISEKQLECKLEIEL